MSKDKREGWLAELKVGDKVAVDYPSRTVLSKVDSITPTGMLDVDGARFNADGLRRGGGGRWGGPSLIPSNAMSLRRIAIENAARRFPKTKVRGAFNRIQESQVLAAITKMKAWIELAEAALAMPKGDET